MAQAADQAQAAESAEETIFKLPSPVTLAAGYSASVPIIDRSLPAERVDLATGNDVHPLSAVRITNDTGTSLPAGILALYNASGTATFAGDARLGGLPVGERRLLSFAQDLRTTVERTSSGETTLASLTAAQGVLSITTRQREVLRLTISAPANEPRTVLVEIPKEGDRTLTFEGGPIAGTEETATAWRVPVSLQPGEVRKLTVYLDRLEREHTELLADDAQVVVRMLNEQTLSQVARSALLRLASLRQDAATAGPGGGHLCANTIGLGVGRDGAFAEQVVLPVTNVWHHWPRIDRETRRSSTRSATRSTPRSRSRSSARTCSSPAPARSG